MKPVNWSNCRNLHMYMVRHRCQGQSYARGDITDDDLVAKLDRPKRKILDYKSEFVNNYKISSGLIKRKKNILQVFAISDENLIYRFVLITNKNEFNIFSEQFEAVAYSFERVSSNQKLSSLDPPKIRILRNLQDKKFISSIKEKTTLQTKYAKEIFETINDLENKPQEKEKIKFIY